jgi:hypothetical protein
VIEAELRAFGGDAAWQSLLLQAPTLQGIADVSPQGVTVSMLLVTAAGAQEAAGRELRLRLVERLQREGLPLADANGPADARED